LSKNLGEKEEGKKEGVEMRGKNRTKNSIKNLNLF